LTDYFRVILIEDKRKQDKTKEERAVILQKDDKYAVECQTKVSKHCLANGEYCDSEEDAVLWVEYECWIDSGEGWICPSCHETFMGNMVKMRYQKEADGPQQPKPKDGLDNDLEKGIDTVL
jgi:hypothetical protein